MSSLREIKTRIASVRSTLQITSAMKRIASAKLHHAQQTIAGMSPYQQTLHTMLNSLLSSDHAHAGSLLAPDGMAPDTLPVKADAEAPKRVVVVAFSSSASLCGSFNANVVAHTEELLRQLQVNGYAHDDIDIYAVGRKIADALCRHGYQLKDDCSSLADHPSYEGARQLADNLLDDYQQGRVGAVLLVYNHYASNSRQPSCHERWLPLSLSSEATTATLSQIVEPSVPELLDELLPRVLRLKVYTVLLDAHAAEHAARTVAMQIASDNADKLLAELTLQYNKSRQQKITSEILDLVGGQQR